jgi:hypothetical protein
MDSLRIYSLVAAGGAVALGVYALLRRKPKGPAELERERRVLLDGIGRITDGTVIDVQELPVSSGHHAAVLLIYKYDVAGVSMSARRTSPTYGSGLICIPAGWGCPRR